MQDDEDAPTFVDFEDDLQAERRASRERIRAMYRKALSNPEQAWRHEELRGKLAAKEREWHAEDLKHGRVPDADMPPLLTTDDAEENTPKQRRTGRTRQQVWDDAQREQAEKRAARKPSFLERMDAKYADEPDNDPVVRGPRRPGGASRFMTAVPQLVKAFVGGAVVAVLLWLGVLWGLSAWFGWYVWGTGLMVGAGVPLGLAFLVWCGSAWDEAKDYVRSGGRVPFRRRYYS